MKSPLFVVFLFFATGTFAQHAVTLKGAVHEAGTSLPLARAVLSLQRNNENALHKATDKDGKFTFSGLKAGGYRLVTAYVGFGSDTQQMVLKNDTTVLVQLNFSSRDLAEVVIRSTIPPATVRNDTIAFNTGAYKSRPNASVEELLKKLPGIQVDKDGNVTMQGKKVDKVLIDGKTFFIDDLRKATRNLPADIIAQVQVFDSQSDAAQQSGITENSDTKTINLKLKKADRNVFVGKAYAGAGSGDSYAAGGNITGLGDRLFSAQVKANNIGNQFDGTGDPGEGTSGKQALSEVHLNYKQDFGKKLDINAYANQDMNQSSQQGSNYRKTFLADSALLQNQQNKSSNKTNNYQIGAELSYKADSLIYLKYDVNWSPSSTRQNNGDSTMLQTEKAGTIFPSSSGSTQNGLQGGGDAFTQNLSFSHRFKKKGRAAELRIAQSISRQQQDQDLFTLVQSYAPSSTKIVDQRSQDTVNTRNYSVSATYAEPLGKTLRLDLNYTGNLSNTRSLKTADDNDPITGQYDLPDSVGSNRFFNRNSLNQFRGSLVNSRKAKLFYDFSLGLQSSGQEEDNQSTGMETRRTFYSFLPSARLFYTLNRGEHFDIWYTGDSMAPTIDQLQPLPDLSNPYLVKLGNPALQQAFVHRMDISYLRFNNENSHSLQLRLDGSYTADPISGATTTLPGGIQQVQFINLAGIYTIDAQCTYGFPLISQEHGSGTIGPGISYGHNRSMVNGEQNLSQNAGVNGRFSLNYHDGESLFIESSATLEYSDNLYSLPGENSSYTWSQQYAVNASYALPLAITTGGDFRFQAHSAEGLPDQQSFLLDAYVAKDLSKDHALQCRFSGFNLLNTATTLVQTTGPGYIATQQTDAQRRLLLFSFVYNFRRYYSKS